MKRLLKRLALVLGAIALAVLALALYVDIDGIPRYGWAKPPEVDVAVTPERVERGRELVELSCAGCHEDPATHRLTGKQMKDLPPEFGSAVSANITRDPKKGIGSWSDGQIEYLLRTGLKPNGQYVPPWMAKMPHLSDEDLHSIVAFLRSDDPLVAATNLDPPGASQPSFLTKVLTHTVFKPLPYPSAPIVAPPKSDKVAYGRYMVFALDCFSCHSPDFKRVNIQEPEKTPGYLSGGNDMLDMDGGHIRSANITPDEETGIGRWSEADFVRAVKGGFRPDGRVLHYPMEVRTALGDDEAAAMYAYLRTVPKLHNVVERPVDAGPSGAPEGKRLYASYGCRSCHGDTGVGLGGAADLRRANEHYPSDVSLREWIDDAPRLAPGTRMPGWRGVIRERDYAPLIGYVRSLGEAPQASNR
jgi:mono/diheme cytochrome c family protein